MRVKNPIAETFYVSRGSINASLELDKTPKERLSQDLSLSRPTEKVNVHGIL